ncbi:MAG: glucose-6-phosphate isomerase, partial [Pseudomonadota bacterium]
FLIASKSFRTEETLSNARAAWQWLEQQEVPPALVHRHFIAITAQIARAREFGVMPGRILPMHEWTGGRFSLWSAIGLPVAMSIGMEAFRDLLEGAAGMDRHFLEAPAADNMPIMMALLDIWDRLYLGSDSHAVLPYAQALARLPDYLQQLEMESLGKSVTRDGSPVRGPTGQVVWGSPGTDGQHSFHQFLHQGTQPVPVDFIAILQSTVPHGGAAHRRLLAHCLAQGRALMEGRSRDQVREEMLAAGLERAEAERLAPHRAIPGNRPSNTLMLNELTPRSLGALLALYEHKVAALGVLWGINTFDQWGVELGKALCGPLAAALESGSTEALDPVSRELVHRSRDTRQD